MQQVSRSSMQASAFSPGVLRSLRQQTQETRNQQKQQMFRVLAYAGYYVGAIIFLSVSVRSTCVLHAI
jgi:hypothetical protein